MSEVNANIVVQPYDITISPNVSSILVTPNAIGMKIFTGGLTGATGATGPSEIGRAHV